MIDIDFFVQSLLFLSLQAGTYVKRVPPTKFVNLVQPIVIEVWVVKDTIVIAKVDTQVIR